MVKGSALSLIATIMPGYFLISWFGLQGIVMVLIIGYLLFCVLSIWVDFMGAPFVPTSGKLVKEILLGAGVQRDKYLIDLGCGEGRVVITAAGDFGMQALGVDLNPFLIGFARFRAKIAGVRNAKFKVENLFKADVSKADYIFLFLMPKTLEKLALKLERECKKDAIIIAHGFLIKPWGKPYKTVGRKQFSTYYYKIRKSE